MSWQHARAALDLDDLKASAKFVLIAVALRAGSDGRAWPSIARVCADTGYTQSTVRLAIQNLAQAGLLGVVHRPGTTLVLTVGAPIVGAPRADYAELVRRYAVKSAPNNGGRSEGSELEVSTAGSSDKRPAVADNGNGGGPAPGESWGEYRERVGK